MTTGNMTKCKVCGEELVLSEETSDLTFESGVCDECLDRDEAGPTTARDDEKSASPFAWPADAQLGDLPGGGNIYGGGRR